MELVSILSLLILNFVLIVVALLFIVWLCQSFLFAAPFLPLSQPVVERVALLSNLTKSGKFYDLGSGDGRVVRAVAKRYPDSLCFGVEKALLPNLLAWVHNCFTTLENTNYLRADFNAVSLDQADSVFLYLWPDAMAKIADKLKTELPNNARVISCSFELPGFSLEYTETVRVKKRSYKLYVYSKPFKTLVS